jgi:hypothetical protein
MFVATKVSISVPRWLADFVEMAAKFYGCTPKYFWTFCMINFVERHYSDTKSLMFSTFASHVKSMGGVGIPCPPTPFDEKVLNAVMEAQQLDKILKANPVNVDCHCDIIKRTNMVILRFGEGEIPYGLAKKLMEPPLNFRPTLGKDGLEATLRPETAQAAEEFVTTYGKLK